MRKALVNCFFFSGLCALCVFVVNSSSAEESGWAMYRGNAQRTGNTDGKAGPAAPAVLWVMPSKEHFVASPAPAGDRLFISGLGAFNVSTFYCLATEPKAEPRSLWTKTTPFLKLPTVSSPAVVGDKLIFGDGMHQTDAGATLYCLGLDKGRPYWQLPVLGSLVHMEGSPTVVDGKVYLGAGSGGVVCVDMNRVTLEGKELDLAAIQKILDQKWADLQAKYEIDKKKDPLLALPPSEDQLPKPAPVLLWQQGKDKWHVDAPVTVAGDRVLVASAFLDKEQLGDRALLCLDAKTGDVKWRKPLPINPWGGPSVAGKTVVVSGSSIGYDPKAIKGAKGSLTAFDLETGDEKWHKDIKGGVVSCAALTDDAAVVVATDGNVRAFDLGSGERRWNADVKTPLFAPPAVVGGVVYAGDLKGVLHALSLADGSEKWTVDLAADPVKAPGMIYGGPAVQGGRVYVATVNLADNGKGSPTAVVCIGEK
jgi:outer membrane protein assembly factor BamB